MTSGGGGSKGEKRAGVLFQRSTKEGVGGRKASICVGEQHHGETCRNFGGPGGEGIKGPDCLYRNVDKGERGGLGVLLGRVVAIKSKKEPQGRY